MAHKVPTLAYSARHDSMPELKIFKTPFNDGQVDHEHYTIVDTTYNNTVIGYFAKEDASGTWMGVIHVDQDKAIVIDEQTVTDAFAAATKAWMGSH